MRILPTLALIALTSITLIQTVTFAAVLQEPKPAAATTDVMNGASTWIVDNDHTSLVCAASHYGLSFIYGRFNNCSGTIEMDFQEPGSSSFRFEVETDSIDTNNASRDFTLRGPRCLDANQYRMIKFESTSVKTEDEPLSTGKIKRTFQVTGNLSLHGNTRQITIPIELLAMGNGPKNNMRCGFMSRFVVSRSDFGLDAIPESVGDSIAVTFCFQAVHEQMESEVDSEAESEREKLEKLFGADEEITIEESETDTREPNKED